MKKKMPNRNDLALFLRRVLQIEKRMINNPQYMKRHRTVGYLVWSTPLSQLLLGKFTIQRMGLCQFLMGSTACHLPILDENNFIRIDNC